ncbi:G-patch domain [Popillia japonica]|uniref:G-patch domain n=1 Tax=Popillia japonica TaxID=7064 RepID=A0AAW1ISZ1_POPJA
MVIGNCIHANTFHFVKLSSVRSEVLFLTRIKTEKASSMDGPKNICSQTQTNAEISTSSSLNYIDRLAESLARQNAKSTADYQRYLTYYKIYYTERLRSRQWMDLQEKYQMDTTNAAAAIAQSAIQQKVCHAAPYPTPISIPNGTDGQTYPIPDITKFMYDKNNGYYYDQVTGLYYDANSTYFWNCVIQQYLYYDKETRTYCLVQSSQENSATKDIQTSETDIQTEPERKEPNEKRFKSISARKVAKDVERWTKHLNQTGTNYSSIETKPAFNKNSANLALGSADLTPHLHYLKDRVKKKITNTSLNVMSRDRAKERRLGYVESNAPQPSKLKKITLESRQTTSGVQPVDGDNVGKKLMRKMGWIDGQGLGKANQGIATFIQAEALNITTAVGFRKSNNEAPKTMAVESYRSLIKQKTRERYQELSSE